MITYNNWRLGRARCQMAQRLGGAVDGDNAVVFSLIKFLDEIFQYLT